MRLDCILSTVRASTLALLALACTVGTPATAGKLARAPVDISQRATGAGTIEVAPAPVAKTAGGIVEVVEYHNAVLDHYFITADPGEITVLDGGAFGGAWKRTGGTFPAWDVSGSPAGTVPVCRFFGTDKYRSNGSRIGPNSHFYTADPAECDYVKVAWQSIANDGLSYAAWTFESNAFAVKLPVGGACPAGTQALYRTYNNGARGDPNHRFTVDLTAHVRMNVRRGDALEGIVMCAPVTDEEQEADVVRFLEQATLGPTEALVQEVKAKGIERWLDEQLVLNVTRYTQPGFWQKPADPAQCIDSDVPPVTPASYCQRNNNSPDPVGWEFFRQARTGSDQVRMRMAHVWHQILVGSAVGFTETYANAEFQQRMRDYAFASFEVLLSKYVLSPQLGSFQNWVLNVPEHDGIKPNENFARELMQLFTIGPNLLRDDGTPVLDGRGQLTPTYAQSDIETMARILTGFTFPTRPGRAPGFWENGYMGGYFLGDMIAFDAFHDRAAKSALGGRISLPPGGAATSEVAAAIRALVAHPNTAPFIVRQIIQKTVTSSPSPDYVRRVALVFVDNGRGMRGDLAAVTKAILLDPEARGARKIDSEYGRLREPALLLTALLRALEVVTDGVIPYELASGMGQKLFYSPTVFNYYPADYTLPSSDVPAPEFGIYDSAAFVHRANAVNEILHNSDQPWVQSYWGPQPWVPNATGTPSPLLSTFLPDAADADRLVARLDKLFLHGNMSAPMRDVIGLVIRTIPAADAVGRTRAALYLILTSVDYQVQK